MSLQTGTITYDNSTDALFRQWGSDLTTLITNSGMTPVAQAGEANFATVAKPTGANQLTWFRCYKVNDGLTEIFLKITGGSGNGGAAEPEIGLQVGYALDGSGGFTGTQTSEWYRFRYGAAAAKATRVCKSGPALVISTVDTQILAFDRSRNATTGAADSVGFTVIGIDSSNSFAVTTIGFQVRGAYEYVPATGGRWGSIGIGTRPYCGIPYSNIGTWARGGSVGIVPIIPWDAGGRPAPIMVMLGSATDFAASGASVTVPVYGTNHNYRTSANNGDTNAASRIMFLDE